MKTILKLAAMVVAGTIIGYAGMSTVLRVRGYLDIVTNGNSWVTAKGIGSKDADPMLKAIVAVIGIFANAKEEAIYFQAYQGSPLSKMKGGHHYQIKGNVNIPGKWWSITLYNEDEFLFNNPDRRYSFTNFNLETDDSGNFTIDVAPVKPIDAENWLPSPSSENISLTFRIYEPEEQLYQNIVSFPLPSVSEVL
ncbi:MAG: DUF1214 domain-containing protein [Deltaproteobacteria bacterium]|nr:DUF1214 domain-containing protein [Deltaproteobacteria bacterium]